MAEKFHRKIAAFRQTELQSFLFQNGHSEFYDILTAWDVTTGQQLLDITELQILKWKLTAEKKRNFMDFLKNLKINPHVFKIPEDSSNVNRRSIKQSHSPFKEQLEQVFNKPSNKPVMKVSPTPASRPVSKVEEKLPESPPNEYLSMEKAKEESLGDFYGDDGYLKPSPAVLEENLYEAEPIECKIALFPPTETNKNVYGAEPKIIKPLKFKPTPPTSISERAPLALPRNSTDERGYILPPKNMTKPANQFSSIPELSPVPSTPEVQTDSSSDNEVFYEPLTKCKQIHQSSISLPSETTFKSKFKSYFTWKRKNSDSVSLDSFPVEKEEQSNKPATSAIRRPLPPVPQKEDSEETPVEYGNTAPPPLPKPPLFQKEKMDRRRSKSEGSTETPRTYMNTGTPVVPPKSPKLQNYQVHVVKSPKSKKALPLPPQDLPGVLPELEQLTIDQGDFPYELNLNSEVFFRNTDRRGAKQLMCDLGNGAFLFRPSRNEKYFLTLSVKYEGKYHNLGIVKCGKNKIRLYTEDEPSPELNPEFTTLSEFVQHFIKENIRFRYNGRMIEIPLTPSLPFDRF